MAVESIPAGDGEQLLQEFLTAVHTAPPSRFLALVDRYAARIGLRRVAVYLVDLQQRQLTPLAGGEPLLVDESLAGWAYRTLSLRVEESPAGPLIAWLPLVNGADRLGVVGVHIDALDGAVLRRCRTLVAVLSMAITSQRGVSDHVVRKTRTDTMSLPAELVRSLLPPRTVGSARAVSTGVLEPAYGLGGDAFDHALTESTLHAVILDAMGHNLASGLTTSIAMAGCRSARRMGAALPELVKTVDAVLAEWLPEQYCTGIAARLDLTSGVLTWCNCGHPPPLLIRDHQVHKTLERPGEPPMGMPATLADAPRTVHREALEPGDRVLLYTDGVTEARTAGGGRFGLAGFTDSIIRATAVGELASEALRQLIHVILESRHGGLSDDATILLLEWQPPGTR